MSIECSRVLNALEYYSIVAQKKDLSRVIFLLTVDLFVLYSGHEQH